MLDETIPVEPTALKAINKINSKLHFIQRKNRYLIKELRRILCNALVQLHFDYPCPAWYPNLNEKTKNEMQIMQNKCIRFCLKLNEIHHISENSFRLINWLPTSKRVEGWLVHEYYNLHFFWWHLSLLCE